MNNDNNNNNFGDYLAAELNGAIRALDLNYELNMQIKNRQIAMPVADESVWEKTVDGGSDTRKVIDKTVHRNIPPSLFGW